MWRKLPEGILQDPKNHLVIDAQSANRNNIHPKFAALVIEVISTDALENIDSRPHVCNILHNAQKS